MATAFGALLGTVAPVPGGATITFNTTAAVPAAGRVVVNIGYFKNGGVQTISGVTVGGNAATMDKRLQSGSDYSDTWSYYSAAGLASAVAVTATWPDSTGTGGRLMGAYYITGTPSTSALDTTGSNPGSGASLSSGAATNTVNATDSIYCGFVGYEDPTNPTTATATNGTEAHDFYDAGNGQGHWSGYLVVTSSASRAITATASNSASTLSLGVLAIYAGIAGGGGATVAPAFQPTRMPLGV